MYERFPFEMIIDQVISLVRLLLSFLSYIYIYLSLSRDYSRTISLLSELIVTTFFGCRGISIVVVSQQRGQWEQVSGVSLENINNPIEKPDRCVSLIINNVHVASTVDARNHRVGRKKDDSKERYEKKGSGGSVFSVLLVRSFAILVSA